MSCGECLAPEHTDAIGTPIIQHKPECSATLMRMISGALWELMPDEWQKQGHVDITFEMTFQDLELTIADAIEQWRTLTAFEKSETTNEKEKRQG